MDEGIESIIAGGKPKNHSLKTSGQNKLHNRMDDGVESTEEYNDELMSAASNPFAKGTVPTSTNH